MTNGIHSMLLRIITSTLFLCTSCVTERLEKVNNALDTLQTLNVFYYRYIHNDESELIQRNLKVIDSLATRSEISAMALNSKLPIIRLYTFQILFDRQDEKAVSIACQQIKDTSKVEIRDYYGVCGNYRDNINNIRINIIQGKNKNELRQRKDGRLSAIDSALLYTKGVNAINYYRELYTKLQPQKKWYKLIKDQYVKYDNRYALIGLAKYKKEDDKELVEKALSTYKDSTSVPCGFQKTIDIALLSVCEWPDPSFVSSLQQISSYYLLGDIRTLSETTKYLFKALIAYDAEWSFEIIERAFKIQQEKNPIDAQILKIRLKEALSENRKLKHLPLLK